MDAARPASSTLAYTQPDGSSNAPRPPPLPTLPPPLQYTLEPVLGAGLAWAMLGERLGLKGFAGAGIILASSLASQVLNSQPREGAEAKGDKAE